MLTGQRLGLMICWFTTSGLRHDTLVPRAKEKSVIIPCTLYQLRMTIDRVAPGANQRPVLVKAHTIIGTPHLIIA